MAWNPSPEIAALRELAPKLKARQVIVIAINEDGSTFGVHTFGKTRLLCDQADKIGKQVFKMVNQGVIEIIP